MQDDIVALLADADRAANGKETGSLKKADARLALEGYLRVRSGGLGWVSRCCVWVWKSVCSLKKADARLALEACLRVHFQTLRP